MIKNSIRVACATRNVSSKELAAAIGVSETQLSKWTNNKVQPSVHYIVPMLAYLQFKFEDLFHEEETKC